MFVYINNTKAMNIQRVVNYTGGDEYKLLGAYLKLTGNSHLFY
jgi:hypothetical protein